MQSRLSAFTEALLDLLVRHGPLVMAVLVLYFAWKLVNFIRRS